MTQTEALKLALEALKTIDEAMPFPVAKLAIKECKAALEAKDEPWEKFCDSHCVWTDHHPDCKLAKDEPVIDESAAKRIATALGWEPKRKPLTDEELREAFERWQTENFAQNLEQYGHTYKNMHVRCRWQGWLAAHGIKGEAK